MQQQYLESVPVSAHVGVINSEPHILLFDFRRNISLLTLV
jgi:hypothetical protein